MPRTLDLTKPTGAVWGPYPSTAERPNVAGSATQTDQLSMGDLVTVVSGADLEVYACTNPAQGAATYAEIPFAGGSISSITLTGTLTAEQVTSTDDINATDDITAGGDLIATAGNITASAGNIAATLGSVAAGTTVTAGTGITATTGAITATAGAVVAGTTVTAGTGITATTGAITATAGAVVAGTTVTAGTGLTVTTGDAVVSAGDLNAVGGHRTLLGPFKVTLAAGQTDTNVPLQGAAVSFRAMRAGSVTAMRAGVDAAITGADQSVQVRVAIAGTGVVASELDFTQAGAETTALYTAAKDTSLHTFAAGDAITVEYDSDTITNTPELEVWLEIEQ